MKMTVASITSQYYPLKYTHVIGGRGVVVYLPSHQQAVLILSVRDRKQSEQSTVSTEVLLQYYCTVLRGTVVARPQLAALEATTPTTSVLLVLARLLLAVPRY